MENDQLNANMENDFRRMPANSTFLIENSWAEGSVFHVWQVAACA